MLQTGSDRRRRSVLPAADDREHDLVRPAGPDGLRSVLQRPSSDPNPYFQQYLSYPAAGSAPETASVRASIPYTVASAMTQPLTMVVRSSRGVRFVDFGLPPKAVTDASDRLLNARDYYIPDCPAIVPLEHGRFGMGWARAR